LHNASFDTSLDKPSKINRSASIPFFHGG